LSKLKLSLGKNSLTHLPSALCASVFLSIYGENSGNITVKNNLMRDVKRNVFLEKKSMNGIVTESGNIK